MIAIMIICVVCIWLALSYGAGVASRNFEDDYDN